MKGRELTRSQRASIDHARALAAIPAGDDEALAVFTGHEHLATVYAVAFAEANHTVRGLLDVIDALTGGQR